MLLLFRKTDSRADIQKRAFTNWCNKHLERVEQHIEHLETDFCDGLKLISLVQIVSGKDVPGVRRKPTRKILQLENVSLAIKFLESDGVQLVNIGTVVFICHETYEMI